MLAEAQVCSGPGSVKEVRCGSAGLETRCNGGTHGREERNYNTSPSTKFKQGSPGLNQEHTINKLNCSKKKIFTQDYYYKIGGNTDI